jgi:hypothetical protein
MTNADFDTLLKSFARHLTVPFDLHRMGTLVIQAGSATIEVHKVGDHVGVDVWGGEKAGPRLSPLLSDPTWNRDQWFLDTVVSLIP